MATGSGMPQFCDKACLLAGGKLCRVTAIARRKEINDAFMVPGAQWSAVVRGTQLSDSFLVKKTSFLDGT